MTTVKVKPLEWKDKSGEDGYEIKWYGTSPAGMTYVAKAVRRGDMILCNGRYHRFIEDAKFMAQADYEQRIMSALSALAPQAGDNAEEPEAWIIRCKGWGEELRFTEDGAKELAAKLENIPGVKKATITPLYSHPCTSTPVVSQNAPALEDKGGEGK